MNDTSKTTCNLLIVVLIIFGSVTFAGCGPKMIEMEQLVVNPESYVGSKVKVSGEIYDIVREGGTVIGKSFTISLTSEGIADLLECEFQRGQKSPPHHLRDGQWVTITGVVDIVQGETLLRECSIVE